ncbi:hypothetical protein L1D52_04160 [Vibrio brasiliensis]|uniref:hypothetical protein n=1 Tax=Vibrio brasiliensis TaxID=170652 RepID=UPI001EFCA0ED|nr:hypothetical protein [Vibrio brasiliensis]MCG9781535.1 hypothetical protein [Vibrio brasiliensis]
MKFIRTIMMVSAVMFSDLTVSGQSITLPLSASVTLPTTSTQIGIELSESNLLLRYDINQGKFRTENVEILVSRSSDSFQDYALEIAENSAICENERNITVTTSIDGTALDTKAKIDGQFNTEQTDVYHVLTLEFPELEQETEAYFCEGYVTLMVTIL